MSGASMQPAPLFAMSDGRDSKARRGGQPLRIAMTVDAVGGVWRYAVELAGALKPFGVEVLLVGSGPEPDEAQIAEAEDVGGLVWFDMPLDWMSDEDGAADRFAEALLDLSAREDLDLLHLNAPSQACGLEAPLPVVAVSHSCLATWWKTMRGRPLPADWRRNMDRNLEGMAAAEAVLAPSASHGALVRSTYGLPEEVTVVHNGLSVSIPARDKQDFVFAAARWWDEAKNAGVLDAAAPDLSWPVHMAGPTTSPTGQRAILSNVTPEPLLHEQVLDNVSRAGIFVSPSIYEPFGLAALEAARAGCTLVLSDIPTYRELWCDVALFFDPHEPRQLVEAIERAAGDSALRRLLGKRARERSMAYSTESQARSMARIYRRLTAERAGRAAARG